MIKSENARLSVRVYVDIRDRDLGSFVTDARETLLKRFSRPPVSRSRGQDNSSISSARLIA